MTYYVLLATKHKSQYNPIMKDSAPNNAKSNGKPAALVAGGAGFLGSYLSEILISQGFITICVDNFKSGTKENIKHLLTHPNFHLIEADLDKTSLTLPPDLKLDLVFHLAGVEEYLDGKDLSLETLMVNSLGTKNLLDLAKSYQSRFILVSAADLNSATFPQTFTPGKLERLLTHHEAKRYAEALASEYAKKYSLDVRIARVKDVYGPRMSIQSGSPLANLLKSTFHQEKFVLEGDGLRTLQPTYVSDVVFGLFKIAISEGGKEEIFHLVNGQKVTLNHLAELLNKLSHQTLEITYKKNQADLDFSYYSVDFPDQREKFNWSSKVELTQGLKATLEFFTTKATEGEKVYASELMTTPLLKVPASPPKAAKKEFKVNLNPLLGKLKFNFSWPKWRSSQVEVGKKQHLKWLITLSTSTLILLALLYPILAFFTHSLLGIGDLKRAGLTLEKGSYDQGFRLASSAENSLTQARYDLANLSWLTSLLGLSTTANSTQTVVDATRYTAESVKFASNAFNPLSQVFKGTFSESDLAGSSIIEKIAEATLDLDAAQNRLDLAEATLERVDESKLPGWLKSREVTLRKEIDSKRSLLKTTTSLVKILPNLLGVREDKRYLLLFQNSTELRATGGFIGSYGLLTFKGGVLKDLLIDDIYNPDGQLKEEITPPDPLRQYLGELRWWLRDSNWKPSYPEAAAQAEWFFEKETGKKVDGTIAINLDMLKKLLAVTGPIQVPDYNEQVSADNIVARSLFHAEIGFFPGSTQKRDFLGNVGRVLLDKLIKEQQLSFNLLDVLKQSLAEKDMLISFNDPTSTAVAREQHWSGDIERCVSCRLTEMTQVGDLSEDNDQSIKDYLYVVDSNLGVNKADIYIKPKIDYLVRVGKSGDLTSSLILSYQHTGENDTWPGGKYKDYVRVYVPEGSELTSSEISDQRDKLQITESHDAGKKVFEFWLQVDPRSTKSVILEYKLPKKIQLTNADQVYGLLVQKQPGRSNTDFKFGVETPDFLTVSNLWPTDQTNMETNNDKSMIHLQQKLDIDRGYLVKFSKSQS